MTSLPVRRHLGGHVLQSAECVAEIDSKRVASQPVEDGTVLLPPHDGLVHGMSTSIGALVRTFIPSFRPCVLLRQDNYASKKTTAARVLVSGNCTYNVAIAAGTKTKKQLRPMRRRKGRVALVA